jgi:hypothetical protein
MEVKQMASTTVIEDPTTESHPFRTLLKILVVVGIVTAMAKFLSDRRRDFYGLTEAEARAKFESKLGPIIGEDRASEVADQVIPRLKESGVLEPDPMDKAKDAAKDLADDVSDATKELADDVGDATKDLADEAKDAGKKASNSMKDAADKVGKKLS